MDNSTTTAALSNTNPNILHVVSNLGEVGTREQERRHYPSLHNHASQSEFRAHGRRYLPHGYSDDLDFVPQYPHIEPRHKSPPIPDWKSSIRYVPTPPGSQYPATENWPQPWKALRTYPPGVTGGSKEEWSLHPDLGLDKQGGLRCHFPDDMRHAATWQSRRERTISALLGRSRVVLDRRNGIPVAAPGDKSYQAPEYSPDFYKFEPESAFSLWFKEAINRTAAAEKQQKAVPYRVKEKARRKEAEIGEVISLDAWRPATPLTFPTLDSIMPKRKQQQQQQPITAQT